MSNLDLVNAGPEVFSALATKAFELGMADGRKVGPGPRNRQQLMTTILPANASFRVFHSKKLRQIYGAGFDIVRLNRYARTKELADASRAQAP